MAAFETRRLPSGVTVVAPDGSDVRVLLGLSGGGMAHFELAPDRSRERSLTERSRRFGSF